MPPHVGIALGYLGTPFVHQGRVPGKGLDCAGVIVCALREVGYDVADLNGYSRLPHDNLLTRACDEQPFLRRRPNSYREPGSVLVFRFGKASQHFALCAGRVMIHSYEGLGSVCAHAITDKWARRITRTYEVLPYV